MPPENKDDQRNERNGENNRRANLPGEIAAFLHEVIQSSLLQFEVLSFFYSNPYAILTITDFAVWISREQRSLADALQRLASLGYLAQSQASSAYALTRDPALRRKLDDFFAYLEANPDVADQMQAGLRREGGE